MDAVRPDYDRNCITNVVRGLQAGDDWIPEPAKGADAIVLLILDGLGWNELQRRASDLPTLTSMQGGPITTVVPSTTPAALVAFSTGLPTAEHGVVGYRMYVGDGVLNVIRWAMQGRTPPDPIEIQPRTAFDGQALPVVTRAQFRNTKFSELLYRGAELHGWHTTSGLVRTCRSLIDEGERFVYAYYDGPDLVAHVHGMRDSYFSAELVFCDRLVSDILDALPERVALVVCADHGHVHFDERIEVGALSELTVAQSGESRFRYLHARKGAEQELLAAARESFSRYGWSFAREQLIDEGWLGPRPPSPTVRKRIGDVILAAEQPVGFVDPENPGESKLRSGHGSLTPDEMLVPLLAGRGRG